MPRESMFVRHTSRTVQAAALESAVDEPSHAVLAHQQHRGRDTRLQNSRFVDWRFLLPGARLGAVAYAGPMDDRRIAALQDVSESLTLIDKEDPAPVSAHQRLRHDICVLRTERVSDVTMVANLIKPDGLLYWEIDRSRVTAGSRPRHTKAFRPNKPHRICLQHWSGYVKNLKMLGFGNFEVTWHRPDFDNCIELIPLDDVVALDYVFARRASGVLRSLERAAAYGLIRTGILGRFTRCFSILARRLDTRARTGGRQ